MKNLLKTVVPLMVVVSMMLSLLPTYAAEDVVYELVYEEEGQQTFYDWGVHVEVDTNPAQTNLAESNPAMFAQLLRDCNIKIHRMNFNFAHIYDEDGTFHPHVVDAYAKNFLIPLAENGCDKYIFCSWRPHPSKRYKDASNRNRIYEELEDEYVQQTVYFLKYMKEKGYPLPTVFSTQNEPDGAHVPLDQLIRLTVKFDKAFEEAGLGEILLAGPDVSSLNTGNATYWGQDFSTFDKYPEYAEAIDMIHYHAYGNHASEAEALAESFRNGLEKYGFRAWQTEVSTISSGAAKCRTMGGGNFFIGHAMMMLEKLCGDIGWLKNDTWLWFMGVNSYDYLFTDKDSVFAWGGEQLQAMFAGGRGADSANSFQRTPIGNMLQILFTNAVSGSVVHRLNSDDPDLRWQMSSNIQTVGLTNDEKTTVVLLNTTDKTKKYDVKGIPGTTATLYSMDSKKWQTVQTKEYNIVDKNIKQLEIEPYSCNIIVTTNEDTAAPRITIDMEDSAFLESDGTYYVAEDSIAIVGSTDEKALVNVDGTKGYTNSDNKFTIKKSIKKDTTFNVTATDAKGNKSQSTQVTVKYNPKFVGIAFDEYDTISTKETYTLNGKSNKEGKLVIGDQTVQIGSDGKFSVDLPLNQGENIFEGIIYADDGNKSNKASIRIMCDSSAPQITVSEENIVSDQRRYLISGTVSEKLKSLTVNGEEIPVNDELYFVKTLKLKEGDNTFRIKATDFYDLTTEKIVKATFTPNAGTYHKVDGVAQVRKATAPIKLDGVLDEAQWVVDIAADKEVLDNPSLTASFGTLWDEKNLYVAAIVKDDKIVYAHQYPYLNDSVELMFNPSNKKSGAWVAGDKQLFSGYINGEQNLYYNIDTMDSAWTLTEDGYVVEFAVPWTTVGVDPKVGLKVGFDVNVNDSDIPLKRNGVVTWSGTENNYLSTSDFGTIVLAGPGDEITYADISDDEAGASEDVAQDGVVIEKDVVKILVNGKETKTKNMPVLENGQLRVSIDTLIEVSGLTHTWLDNNTVVIEIPGIGDMTVQADNPTIQIGIHPDIVDVTPYKIDGGIYIGKDFPEKYCSGYFMIDYSYDEKTKTISFEK